MHARVEREPGDLGLLGQRLGLLGRQLDGEAVDERDLARDLATVGADELITARFTLAETGAALEAQRSGAALKAVVIP